MKVRTKLIIVGTVMILHANQKAYNNAAIPCPNRCFDRTDRIGTLSQDPSPSPCYDSIMEVGDIFCTITGQHGLMNFFWPALVVMCKDAYLNLSIPFNVKEDDIVICLEDLKKEFDTWKKDWQRNEKEATKALCDHTDRHR
uniref:Putative ixodes 10 kDa peptide protein n=1 Tax=Ixodes ricinus TaxID=34613 RepID=A0A0K8RHP8_IXORI